MERVVSVYKQGEHAGCLEVTFLHSVLAGASVPSCQSGCRMLGHGGGVTN